MFFVKPNESAVTQHSDGREYFRVALAETAREVDRLNNAFSGELKEEDDIVLEKEPTRPIILLLFPMQDWRMIKFFSPLELPPQLNWKFADEPALMEWTIRTRNYNTTVANCIFAFMATLISLLTYIGHPSKTFSASSSSEILWSALFFTVLLFTISTMTHQKMNFAYRFTHSGLECCEWKDFPKWALPALRWIAGITAIIFISMATIDPSFLIGALVGPGGVGLMYLQMAYSKNFRALHRQYHHLVFTWNEFTQIAIATNRELVDLKYKMILDGDQFETEWNINIYCKRNQKEVIAAFITPHLLPSVPSVRAKVNVPMSTD